MPRITLAVASFLTCLAFHLPTCISCAHANFALRLKWKCTSKCSLSMFENKIKIKKDNTWRSYFTKVFRHSCSWRRAESSHNGSKWLVAEDLQRNVVFFFCIFSGNWTCILHIYAASGKLTNQEGCQSHGIQCDFSPSPFRTDTRKFTHLLPCTCVTLCRVLKALPSSTPFSLWVYLAVSARCSLQYVPNVWTPFGENGACPSGWLGEGLMMKR